jgi:hypothetical protein
MINKERLDEAKRNVKLYMNDELLKVDDKEAPRFVDFFMANAESSLRTASILQQISDENVLKETLKVGMDFESYLWVIVSSYYAMFYAATAILAKQGISFINFFNFTLREAHRNNRSFFYSFLHNHPTLYK